MRQPIAAVAMAAFVTLLLTGFALSPAAYAECTLEAGNHQRSVMVGGLQRTFRLFVPEGCDPASPPFHGV